MEERDNKTIICSVLFLDIVDYSQKAVSGQITLKEGFNSFLSSALVNIPVADRIILDTGDGAAISFLGDIEDALKVGLSMRESLLNSGMDMEPPLLVRMGINLGPVRLVKDINNQPNIVGDGINVAQRVMGFSDVGQLLVSRSYYDSVSRISQLYAGMFHYQGSRTDKHVREHEVYAIGYPGEFSLSQRSTALVAKLKRVSVLLMRGINQTWLTLLNTFRSASNNQRIIFLGVSMFAFVMLAGVLTYVNRSNFASMKQVVVRYYPDAEQLANVTSVNKADNQLVIEQTGKELDKSGAAKKIGKTSIARVRTLEETTGEAAVMNLVVLPWGEVYLDGRMQGVSPPLLELQVAPGAHEIEIRNTKFPVYKQSIQATVGEKLTIKHTFAN